MPLRQRFKQVLFVALQVAAAAGLAIVVAKLLRFDRPIGAPLFAVTTLEFICAKHRRNIAYFVFGLGFGLAIAAVAAGYRTWDRVLLDFLVGVVVAVVVAYLTRDRNPIVRVHETVIPILNTMTVNIRAVAHALRDRDEATAKAAVYNLTDTDESLRRLDEVLRSVKRSGFFAGKEFDQCVNTAAEISYAVRNVRLLARHAWWGVLHGDEPVPNALPPMLSSLADGISLLRDEFRPDGRLRTAYPQLISAARWIDVMRSERLGMASAAVAAGADAAVLNLLIATGIPLAKADAMLNHVRTAPRTYPAFA